MKPTGHTANTASTPKTGLFASLRGLLHIKGTTAPKITQETGASSTRSTNQVSLGRPTAVKTFTRNNNNEIQPRISRQATTKGISTQLSCVANSKQPRSLFFTSVKRSLFPSSNSKHLGSFPLASVKRSLFPSSNSKHLGSFPLTSVKRSLFLSSNSKQPRSLFLTSVKRSLFPSSNSKHPGSFPLASVKRSLFPSSNSKHLGFFPFTSVKRSPFPSSNSKHPRSFPLASVKQSPSPSSTPKHPRPLSLTSITPRLLKHAPFSLPAVLFLYLAISASPAVAPSLASGLEKPATFPPTEVKAETATLQGALSPKSPGELGSTYEFIYRESPTTCKGTGELKTTEGMSLGGEDEPVPPQPVAALKQGATYAVCLVAHNAAKTEEAVSAPIIFTTAITPEQPALKAEPITASTATLHGVLNPKAAGNAGTYELIYRELAVECQGTGQQLAGSGTITGSEGQAVEAELAGLSPGVTYAACLIARNEAGEEVLTPTTFKTLALPATVTGESSSELGPTTATLSAEINAGGAPTGYRVQYVTAAHFNEQGFAEPDEAPAPPAAEASAGSADTTVTVHQELTGLQAGTEYHFRFVAKNAAGPSAEGVTETFTTLPEGTPGLPDDRAFERVTPVENYDATTYVPDALGPDFVEHAGEIPTKLPFQVATDGEAVAYVSSPTVGGTGNIGDGLGNEYLARRLPGGGWGASINVQPKGVSSAFYQAFSPDLMSGVLEAGAAGKPTVAPLSAQAPGKGYVVLYTRALDGETYQPFFTATPPNRAAGEFKAYEVPDIYAPAENELAYAGASADFSRLLFEADDAFVGTGAVDGGAAANNLYESVGGRLGLVNVLPDGSTEANATFGAMPFSRPEKNLPDFENVISGDGSRVFWTDLNPGKENLYVSEGVGSGSERTLQVDASQVPGGKGGGGRFWKANKEGTRVFFTDSDAAELTSDTRAGSGQNLYMYEVPTGKLVDLTAAADVEVEGVLGEGESEAGEYTIYFTAKGVLDETANSNGVKAEAGADNLYTLSQGSKPKFIAALTEQDGKGAIEPLSPTGREEFGDWQPGLGHRTAEVTPDGHSLVFMSKESLTGYRNEVGGVKDEEVYVYEAEGGGLFCVSCNRSGEAGQSNPPSRNGVDAYLPVSWSTTYMPELISEDGSRVFFDSDQPLVPQDTNNEQDVYEWERNGSGGCRVGAGCVYLLSGGVNEAASWLIGASASGDDVFVVSREQLVPGKSNGAYDLYDARVGAVPVSGSACTGTGCQGVPSAPPAFATPPSVTFNGVGNFPPPAPAKPAVKPKPKAKALTRAQKLAQALKACREFTTGRRRAVCEARERKRYRPRSKAKSRKGGK